MIRVLVVDDQELVRAGLRGILRTEFGFNVVTVTGMGRRPKERPGYITPCYDGCDRREPR